MASSPKNNTNKRRPLSQTDPTPLYFRLYSRLKQNILDGTLKHGSQLPTEKELSQVHNISRVTAIRALNELAADGLVSRQRAKGTHVTHKYTPKPVKAPLIGMLQEIESMARHSVVKVIEINDVLPPAEVSGTFNLTAEETTLKMIRVRIRDGEPFGYYISWSRGLDASISEDSLKTNSRLEIFRKNGIHITHVQQTLTAVPASVEVASELEVESGFPLLKLVRQSFDKDENLVDFLVALYHPERFQYQMDLTVES